MSTVPLKCPLDYIQVAKDEAKIHSHCICMTESDRSLSKKCSTVAKQPSQGSPTNGSLRTFKMMEHDSASELSSAISFLSSSNPTLRGFVSLEQHELRKRDLARVL